MDGTEIDIECVACGFPIKYDQRAGNSVCGHGNIHYNCSYLSAKCDVCNETLMYDVNQDSLSPVIIENSRQQHDDDDDESESESEVDDHSEFIMQQLNDIKTMLIQQRDDHIKLINAVDELKKELKGKDHKILELQNDILQMKLENMKKEHKDLQEKMKSLAVTDE